MEKNNGSESNATLKELLEQADPKIQQFIQNLYTRLKIAETEWMRDRVMYLFRVVETEAFSPETRRKASDELEAFLFPKPIEPEETK